MVAKEPILYVSTKPALNYYLSNLFTNKNSHTKFEQSWTTNNVIKVKYRSRTMN